MFGDSDGSGNSRVSPYSSFQGLCIVFNYAMSNGYLTVPYVLWHTGIFFGIITLISVAFFSAISAFWTLETMARAQ
jgi:amino acid permease